MKTLLELFAVFVVSSVSIVLLGGMIFWFGFDAVYWTAFSATMVAGLLMLLAATSNYAMGRR